MQAGNIRKWFPLLLASMSVLSLALISCSRIATTNTASTPSSNVTKPTVSSISTTQNATVSISIANPNIQSGENFTIDIVINSHINLRGAQCALIFNPALMKCDRVSEGNYFKNWAVNNGSTTLVVPQPTIDNGTGRVSDIGVAIMGTKGGGVQGSGIFCTYYFTALANGTISPTLSDVLLADENGKTMSATVLNK